MSVSMSVMTDCVTEYKVCVMLIKFHVQRKIFVPVKVIESYFDYTQYVFIIPRQNG